MTVVVIFNADRSIYWYWTKRSFLRVGGSVGRNSLYLDLGSVSIGVNIYGHLTSFTLKICDLEQCQSHLL